jgi:hypothetical protein
MGLVQHFYYPGIFGHFSGEEGEKGISPSFECGMRFGCACETISDFLKGWRGHDRLALLWRGGCVALRTPLLPP